MNEKPYRPILVLMTVNWMTMAGSALVTFAIVSWLFLIPVHASGEFSNPYTGLLAFVAVPVILFLGLILVPIGLYMARRRGTPMMSGITDRRAAWRKAILFFGAMTALNVLVGGQVTYRAVEHMDTQQFCGQTCHAMTPQFISHASPPHLRVACVSCHVSPGASGWFKAKTAGTRRLVGAIFDNFEKPIDYIPGHEGAVSSTETCEQCHARETTLGPRVRILPKFADDEANSRSETVLIMKVGGGSYGGIHGAHLAPGISIRYAATDAKRQTIPRVEYRNTKTGFSGTYFASGATAASTKDLTTYVMQCADCHNRVAHSFDTTDRAVNRAMAAGEIPASLPFAKKASMAILEAKYTADGAAKIPALFENLYRTQYPKALEGHAGEVKTAGAAILAIYRRNVFPELKVGWGTYPLNLGHTASAGCFRCHDNDHSTVDGKVVTQDCEACHQALAVDEKDPKVLTDLGIGPSPVGGTK